VDQTRSETFILDLRRAAGLIQKPTVLTSGVQLMNGETYATVLRQADLWLTPKVVEQFDPADFQMWEESSRLALAERVAAFRKIAETVAPNKPATEEQYRAGLSALKQLVEQLGSRVLAEWQHALSRVIMDVESWCAAVNVAVRKEPKEVNEGLLGTYQTFQVLLYFEQHLYVFDPLARFVPGAKGLIDLSIQPSYSVTSLYRGYDDGWFVNLDVGQGARGGRREPLNKDSFFAALKELRSLL
jgi:hypothetical protein